VAGDASDWAGTGAGYADLYTTLGVDWLQNAEKIGNYVAVYGERSIVLMEYTGDVNNPFNFVLRVAGVGLAAPRALINLGDEHIFLSWDGVYSYTGGRTVNRIDEAIRDELLSTINPSYINRSFMVYIEETDELRLHIPSSNSELPDTYYSYNLKTGSWGKGKRSFTGYGYYSRRDTLTIDEMTASIDSYTWLRFDDARYLALSPINLFGDGSGVVLQDSELVYDLNGRAIVRFWETKDFVQGEGYRRTTTYWCELNFEARGSKVVVKYSTDGGQSWSAGKEFELSGEWERYRYDIEEDSELIRFRCENTETNGGFELKQFEVGFIGGSNK